MKVLVFGNSGSGKSTYARAIATREGLAHLDLDSIVWEPGKIAVQRPCEAVRASLRSFIDLQAAWVIEGCYDELVRAASAHCTLLVFLNPGMAACLRNNLRRPWEPHKYASFGRGANRRGTVLGWSGGIRLVALAFGMMIVVAFAIVVPLEVFLSNQLSASP